MCRKGIGKNETGDERQAHSCCIQYDVKGLGWRVQGCGAAPDPSTQFSLFRLYIFEHPTFHSAQDDEMRRGVSIVLREEDAAYGNDEETSVSSSFPEP